MNKINVLHILAVTELNGGKSYILQLADNLPKDKYNLFFALPWDKYFFGELEKRNIKPMPINAGSQFNILTFIKLKRFIMGNKIDIVHTHGARAGFYGRLAAKWANAAIILSTVHCSICNYSVSMLRKKIYLFLDKLTSYFCDKLICVSNSIADDLIYKSRINPKKIAIIHNGIDSAKFEVIKDSSCLKGEFGLSKDQKAVGTVGRMVYCKGQRYLLEALAKITVFLPDIRCLLVGDGPLKNELERLAKKLGISQNCIFTGRRTDIPEILSFLDILVLPSLSEGFPIILLEAMAIGCPIVSTDVGGVKELIENERTGLLIPPRNSQALAEAIRELLQNKEKTKFLSSSAQTKVREKFSLRHMIDETESIYEQLIRKKGRNGKHAKKME